jgi:hypothetical protein
MLQDHDLLMMSLGRFYANPEHIQTVVDIVKGRSDISLRIIDWFITNYSRSRNIIHIRTARNGAGASQTYFNVYLSYRAQLKTFSKQQFDPFRRNERILFQFRDAEEGLETTVGQLNFFRWAIENNIIDYIRQHKAAIESSMSSGGKRAGRRADEAAGGDGKPDGDFSDRKEDCNGGRGGATGGKAFGPTILRRCPTIICFD